MRDGRVVLGVTSIQRQRLRLYDHAEVTPITGAVSSHPVPSNGRFQTPFLASNQQSQQSSLLLEDTFFEIEGGMGAELTIGGEGVVEADIPVAGPSHVSQVIGVSRVQPRGANRPGDSTESTDVGLSRSECSREAGSGGEAGATAHVSEIVGDEGSNDARTPDSESGTEGFSDRERTRSEGATGEANGSANAGGNDLGRGRAQAHRRDPTRVAAQAEFDRLMGLKESELLDHERPKVRAILQNLILRELYKKVHGSDFNVAELVSTNLF